MNFYYGVDLACYVWMGLAIGDIFFTPFPKIPKPSLRMRVVNALLWCIPAAIITALISILHLSK
jgi:hypothetical protein